MNRPRKIYWPTVGPIALGLTGLTMAVVVFVAAIIFGVTS